MLLSPFDRGIGSRITGVMLLEFLFRGASAPLASSAVVNCHHVRFPIGALGMLGLRCALSTLLAF